MIAIRLVRAFIEGDQGGNKQAQMSICLFWFVVLIEGLLVYRSGLSLPRKMVSSQTIHAYKQPWLRWMVIFQTKQLFKQTSKLRFNVLAHYVIINIFVYP